jgi:hypothetical protein
MFNYILLALLTCSIYAGDGDVVQPEALPIKDFLFSDGSTNISDTGSNVWDVVATVTLGSPGEYLCFGHARAKNQDGTSTSTQVNIILSTTNSSITEDPISLGSLATAHINGALTAGEERVSLFAFGKHTATTSGEVVYNKALNDSGVVRYAPRGISCLRLN